MNVISKAQRPMIICILLIFSLIPSFSQQVSDTLYSFPIQLPQYLKGCGPQVLIDQAHNNFHTRNGGYLPFAKLLEQDGYNVAGLDSSFRNIEVLKQCKILVIANALDSRNTGEWVLPIHSAFTTDEIQNLVSWVINGGSLLLIADHMPFAGAVSDLAKAFDFEFVNGFAFTGNQNWPPSTFSLKDSTLIESPIINGRIDLERVSMVATFSGSAFKAPESAIPILSFLENHFSLQPDTAWKFNSKTPRINLGGYQQGAIIQYGSGRIAVFGEAAMFTAQIANGTIKAGFNSELAPQNAQFTLNMIHWLDGLY